MLPLNLHTCVDDTIRWPRHNYEKDHEANVQGPQCGCGREWSSDMVLHSLEDCVWMKRTGDVIYSGYDKPTNHDLNVTKSYCELAVKTTCRCIPSWSLLKHGALENQATSSYYGHLPDVQCEWGCSGS